LCLLIITTARASPIARRAVVLVVGARPSGQASVSTPTSITRSLCWASVEFLLPVNAMIGHPAFRILGSRIFSSSVSPLLESAINTSLCDTIPKSPCMASTGCRKMDRVPVLFNVAAIFLPIIPDFPMPPMITRPRDLYIKSTILVKFSSTFSVSARMPFASIFKTSTACSMVMGCSSLKE